VPVVVEAMSFEAQDLIGQAIKKHKGRICVNWSGGRDSTVVLHMALKEDPQIPVIFANTLCEHGATWAYIRKLWKEWDLNLHMSYPIKPYWQCVKEYGLPKVRQGKDKTPKCCMYMKEYPMDALKKSMGINAYFTGLMKDESRQRFLTLSRYDNSGKSQDEIAFCAQRYYKKTTDEWAYHPIANWSSEDIDQYFIDNNLPINQFYVMWGGIYKRSGCFLCTAFRSWKGKLRIASPTGYARLIEIENQERDQDFNQEGKLGTYL
jgi:3'-phosphoadenosine 5'-phosphosulfate sulfotransferase (PAPS reductase)/FAD synthetase